MEVTRPQITSRDLLYSRVPRINATVLCTQEFAKRVDLISVLILIIIIIKTEGRRKLLEVMDRDCGEGFAVYTYL